MAYSGAWRPTYWLGAGGALFLKKVKLHVLQQLAKIQVFWCTKIYTIRHEFQMLSHNTGFAGTNDIFYEKTMVKGNFNDLTIKYALYSWTEGVNH